MSPNPVKVEAAVEAAAVDTAAGDEAAVGHAEAAAVDTAADPAADTAAATATEPFQFSDRSPRIPSPGSVVRGPAGRSSSPNPIVEVFGTYGQRRGD
jgi:hypothetical protein